MGRVPDSRCSKVETKAENTVGIHVDGLGDGGTKVRSSAAMQTCKQGA